MPKITLMNTESGQPEDFEPVDAREILSQKGSIYTVPVGTTDQIGLQMDARSQGGINIPQLQGDAEMSTGLSVDKYGRGAVVKALPGFAVETPVSGTKPAVTTTGKVIDDSEDDTTKMKVVELKAALDSKGIEYPATAKKADLQALLDGAPQ